MDILAYLETLLKTHKEVGLNGFGTFYKTKTPGRYDENTNSYLPPHYDLNFRTASGTDELLAQTISAERNLSLNTTSYHVEEFVKTLNQELAENGKVMLGNLGVLSVEGENYHFTANKNLVLGQDFFGYPPVKDRAEFPVEKLETDRFVVPPRDGQLIDSSSLLSTEELQTENSKLQTDVLEPVATQPEALHTEALQTDNRELQTEEPEPFEAPFTAEVMASNENDTPTERYDAVVPEIETEENLYIEEEETASRPGYIKWLIIIFLILAVCAVALMLKPSIYEGWFENKTADTSAVSFNKESLKNQKDTLSNDSALINNIQSAINDSIPATKVNADSTTYEVYATAVKTQKDAEKYIARYNKMGLTGKAFPGKFLINISVASFLTERAARDSLPALKKILKDNSIYIQKNKPK